MRRRTLWFLVAGCALVLWLETPHTLAALATTDDAPGTRPTESARRTPARPRRESERPRLDSTIELAKAPVRRAG